MAALFRRNRIEDELAFACHTSTDKGRAGSKLSSSEPEVTCVSSDRQAARDRSQSATTRDRGVRAGQRHGTLVCHHLRHCLSASPFNFRSFNLANFRLRAPIDTSCGTPAGWQRCPLPCNPLLYHPKPNPIPSPAQFVPADNYHCVLASTMATAVDARHEGANYSISHRVKQAKK